MRRRAAAVAGGRRAARAVVLVAAAWALSACSPCERRPLAGGPLLREAGETPGRLVEGVAVFRVPLAAEQVFHVRIEQTGTDFALHWLGPKGCLLLAVDSPNGPLGPEELAAVAPRRGVYRLEVRGPAAAPPDFRLEVRRLGAADSAGRALAEGMALYAEAEARRNAAESALPIYRRVVEHAQQAAAPLLEARARRRMGRIHYERGEVDAAVEHFEVALPIFRQQTSDWEVTALANDAGTAYRLAGDPSRARALFEEVIARATPLGHLGAVAVAHNNLGVLEASLGDPQAAILHYDEALELHGEEGLGADFGDVLHNLGEVYRSLGRTGEALDFLRRALAVQEQAGNAAGRARTLTALGWLRSRAGEPAAAVEDYQRAIELRRKVGDRTGQAVSLDLLGALHREQGRLEEAECRHREALAIHRATGNRLHEAHTLHELARLRLAQGRVEEAEEQQRQALAIFRRHGDLQGEASALAGLARVERRLGRWTAAVRSIEEALAIDESLRARLQSLAFRSAYFETRFHDFELYIDLLMELHAREEGAGHAARAFEVSEQARARSLLDSLVTAAADGALLPPPLRRREKQLRGSIAGLESARLRRLQRQPGADVAPLEEELRGQLLAYEKLRGEIRAAAEPAPAEPVPLARAQRLLLDEDTTILAYHLGAERGFLWVIGRRSLETFELLPRSRIETLARRAHEVLQNSHLPGHRAHADDVLRRLSEAVLEPASGALGARRLLMVADGALRLVPFSVLPAPAGEGPLLLDHEIVHLPSVSVAVRLRQRAAARPSAGKVLAMLAAPAVGEAGAPPAAIGMGGFGPLPYAAREADAILELVEEDRRLAALGPRASRDLVLSGALADYQVVHFAVHGRLHATHPDLSGLLLSQADEEGNRRDGTLWAHEIAALRLRAELVVLSACETALGKEIRGEGLVGLPVSFFQAGAPCLVVSLWSVHDEATSVLMEHFYRAQPRLGTRPVAALHQAQLALRGSDAWSAPYYWAGFTLQGDCR